MAQKKKILIVDDDENIRKTFSLVLSDKYQIFSANDAREAFQCFKRRKIDLLITDLRLPDCNGLEMITQFRESGYGGDIILISAYPDKIAIEELQDLSVGYFFSKPLDLDSLNSSIEYLLDTKAWYAKRAEGL